MYTRREFGKLTLAGLTLPAFGGLVDSVVSGVHLGVQTYSFRDMTKAPTGDAVDVVVKAIADCGLSECELFAPHVEPRSNVRGGRGAAPSPEAQQARQDLRKWRLETPMDHFHAVRQKFNDAGISIYAYNYSFNHDYTDAEI